VTTRERILDAALERAARMHWERVRLADVAAGLGITLAQVRAHFTDKEALVDALWDRADAALVARAADAELATSSVPQRLEALVFAWLAPLAPHRRTVREMLLVRLEPGHLHVQLPSLLRVSKTVQWLREAAGLRAAFARRALEETALTLLFTATVARWLRDADDARARELLRAGLRTAETFARGIGLPCASQGVD